MSSLNPVRGTHDLLPDEKRRQRFVEDMARLITGRYGFQEMATPIFEFSEVFSRTLGDTSDIVTKEMYAFETRGGEAITLRPEGTAGVARAFISNSLSHDLPLKFFYHGPMFRFERPQKGRQRQFHQIGVELLGVPGAQADVEVISLAAHLLSELGLSDRIALELNSLGDIESRVIYRDKLVAYFQNHLDGLSEDSRNRLDRNPLRILDSKNEGDREIIADAPLLADSLNDISKAFFDDLVFGLESLGVAYKMNPRLVRGLDYYCHTAFEFTTDTLGAQGAVLAGGRYDGLIKQMGGPATPGIGWAAGMERLAMMVGDAAPAAKRPIVVVPVGAEAAAKALTITDQLRKAELTVELGYSGNVGKRMKRANKLNARVVILLGEDELARNAATVRDMESGDQTEVPLPSLEEHLSQYR
jgi:histidyl-tRNA synthetase